LPRHFNALPVSVELQTVISALQIVTNALPQRKWQRPMATAVFQGNGVAGLGPKQDNLIVEQRSGQRLTTYFADKGSNIPCIAQKHR